MSQQNWVAKPKVFSKVNNPVIEKVVNLVENIQNVDKSDMEKSEYQVLSSDSEISVCDQLSEVLYYSKLKQPKTKKAWVSLFN